jgi:hypothetical protein
MKMQLSDFDKGPESFKLKDDAPDNVLEPFIDMLKTLNEAFHDMDEKISLYSMYYSMDYLITVKKLKFIIETTIKNNRENRNVA